MHARLVHHDLIVAQHIPVKLQSLVHIAYAENGGGDSPHIVFVLIDDQGYADMGYNNDLDVLSKCTPFMDQLAGDGIKLTQYYTQQLCTPARAALPYVYDHFEWDHCDWDPDLVPTLSPTFRHPPTE